MKGLRAFTTGDQSGRQLQGVVGVKGMQAQKAQGPLPQLFGGLNLGPARGQGFQIAQNPLS
jgi:hypothetical protein